MCSCNQLFTSILCEDYPRRRAADLAAGLSGTALLNASWYERRVEFAEESLRYWDLVRTGRHLAILPADVRALATTHLPTESSVNPFPLLPISLNDAQTWYLPQNPGY